MKIVKTAVFFLGLFLVQIIHAQVIRENYTLKWKPVRIEKISEEITRKYLYFENAVLGNDEKSMPVFFCEFPVASENLQPQVKVLNAVWETLKADELEVLDVKLFADTLKINAYVEATRKKPDVKIKFLPFRKNGNSFEKLISFQIECSLSPTPPKRTQKSNTYVENSILKNGNFYKMEISKTGIHKITLSDLTQMGITQTVSVGNIAVFGNGGRLLPENTAIPVPDDLQEIAIQVVDQNSNGIFDKEDYILFYGIGITNWNNSPSVQEYPQFTHELNFYTNQAYYYINVEAGIGSKKRIFNAGLSTQTPTHQVNTYYFRDVYEKEKINPFGMSRIWLGEEFISENTQHKVSFSVPERLKNKPVFVKIQVASKSNTYANFTAKINEVASFNMSIGNDKLQDYTYSNTISSGDNIDVNITYSKPTNSSIGYLDYVEIHTTCALSQNAGQFSFRNPETVGIGNVAEYQFDTKGKSSQIWEVTDPFNAKKINVAANGGKMTYRLSADTLREFVAFDGTDFFSVTPVSGKVANQNLHKLKDLDFIIITDPKFLQSAEKLAAHRRSNDGMRTAVVTTTQVYNEFGSGIGDISAIRNFLKMFYDRAETEQEIPKNVLLIGKTSYDFRNISGTNSCFIPNYQGRAVFDHNCPSTDNFFTKLADGKGAGSSGSMDMGLGRFSVSNTSQAAALVEKSIIYSSMKELTNDAKSNYVSNLGDWRNMLCLIADDNADGQEHIKAPEASYHLLLPGSPFLNFEKIYCDAYVPEISANGKRYPAVNNAINSRVNRGCLMLAYFGHGGDNGWAHERILQRSDIFSWTNKYCMPFIFTGCCSFAGYDKKDGTSPAEDASLLPNGGAIGLITSTRDTYGGQNKHLYTLICKWAFSEIDNRYLTLGEIHAKSQKDYGGDGYDTQILLGDPSATLARPHWDIVTDSINGAVFSATADTLKSLQYITISGHVKNDLGNKATNFNGWIYPTIFDKADTVSTVKPIFNDDYFRFVQQKNTIFKGKTKVTNGEFSFRFIVPKDIDYTVGEGKISYYAKSEGMDALGYNRISIGGVYDTTFNDTTGAIIKLYLNDEKFVSGGITDPNPIILAKISDETGINTASSGIGHDIVAILDNNVAKSITLNDYFEFDENSFTSGKLRYPLRDLAVGKHTLTLRVWDVLNNIGEATIDFEVAKNEKIELTHVLNYPNPFTTSTQFFFEHNRPNTPLIVSLQIMTISGKVVKTYVENQQSTGYRCAIPEKGTWNGRDEFGDKLAKGVYIYKLKVIAPDGSSAEKIEKLVIL